MIKVGVIGYGYWGPNLVRNFYANPDSIVTYVADLEDVNLQKVASLYPNIKLTKDAAELTSSADVDIVAIATPVWTHHGLARQALENGKHVFVEKPFTLNAEEAEDLINTAEQKNLKIMVDHTFTYTPAVMKMKELISGGTLGDLYYYDSSRVNLGLFQTDVNVIWDLAPHDFSIIDYIMPHKPLSVSAHGVDHFERNLENVAYITVRYDNNLIAHFNLNWLSPVKLRTTLVGGSKKMLVWNDLEPDEKIRIYDKGVNIADKESMYKMLVNYRSGDVHIPKLAQTEALSLETKTFIDAVSSGEKYFNDGAAGLRVVKMLEACNKSIAGGGEFVDL